MRAENHNNNYNSKTPKQKTINNYSDAKWLLVYFAA